jgi:hypothetical protein
METRSDPTQLPDEVREKLKQAILEASAALQSDNDPLVMASFKEPPSKAALLGLTVAFTLLAYIIASISNYQEIRRNWSHYRCQPNIAPFAKFYGHDLTETMNFCVGQSVKEHAPGVIAPIYKGISEVSGVVDGIMTKVDAVEGGVGGLLKGFESFVINFLNSFRLVGVRIRMSLIAIREIFERVYGTFIAFTYAAISAITFGENLVCNPLVAFIGTIAGVDICCFAPDTLVAMEDGSVRQISDVRVGDRLVDDAEVTTTFVFEGKYTDMVSVYGVTVSGNHYLRNPTTGRMVRADKHPAARPAKSHPYIYCLSTSTHRIPVVSLEHFRRPIEFADYEESSDPAVVASAQAAAERALNGSDAGAAVGPTVPDYSLGIAPGMQIQMAGGTWRSIALVKVGDHLASGAHVTGVVREECSDVYHTPGGIRITGAQLVHLSGKWVRAAHVFEKVEPETTDVYTHVFVSNNGPFAIANREATEMLWIRDYAEWSGPETQEPYDAALAAI